jgi:hypothetical protein
VTQQFEAQALENVLAEVLAREQLVSAHGLAMGLAELIKAYAG